MIKYPVKTQYVIFFNDKGGAKMKTALVGDTHPIRGGVDPLPAKIVSDKM